MKVFNSRKLRDVYVANILESGFQRVLVFYYFSEMIHHIKKLFVFVQSKQSDQNNLNLWILNEPEPQRTSNNFRELQRTPENFRELQRTSENFRELQRTSENFRELQGAPRTSDNFK